MNGHGANQIHPFANTSQQTQADILLNGIATQHNRILEHVSRIINDNFRVLYDRFNGFYDMSHKQNIAQNVEQRRIVNELSEIRARTETLSTALNSLCGQMQQLENSQDAISLSLKRLNGGMGQLDDRLGSLNEKTRQVDLNVQEIAEFVKDPKAFGSCLLFHPVTTHTTA
jgi:chromosome segregation ATPase